MNDGLVVTTGAGAVAVKVADVAAGALTTLYEPACAAVYEPVPAPLASIVTVNEVIVPSGAVTCTVCVENAVKPVSVIVAVAPTVTEEAAICGEPGGDEVGKAPARSAADAPIVLTARTENVCHADGARPVAVYVVPTATSMAVPSSTLTVYFEMAAPPVFDGAVQLAVIVVEVAGPNTRFIGASGTVARVD